MAKIVELIYAETKVGSGTDEDPNRMVQQLWTKDGRLVAEEDRFDALLHDQNLFLSIPKFE